MGDGFHARQSLNLPQHHSQPVLSNGPTSDVTADQSPPPKPHPRNLNWSSTTAFTPFSEAAPPSNPPPMWKLTPVKSLTVHLGQSYSLANPNFRLAPLPLGRQIPRKFLTAPAEPVGNGGLDNEHNELIMAVNDILVNSQGRKYVVKGMLGSGTFGIVAACHCNDFPEEVAVKVIKNHPAYHTQARVELGVLQYLNVRMDPSNTRHIIRLHDAFYFRKHLCLVFEKLDVNLYDILRSNRHRGLSFNLIRIFCSQILDTLILLRESSPGVVHCDLKPENVMVRRKGPLAKVIDYGSSVFLGRQTPTTYIQSRFYRSPEIILGCPYGLAIDMWSFGCLAAELFLGMPLFPADTEHDLLTRQVAAFGNPPDWVLKDGRYTSKYFQQKQTMKTAALAIGTTARPQLEVAYELLSREEFEAANKRSAKVGKQLWRHQHVEDIVNHYPIKDGLSDEALQEERTNRECFIDFLMGILDLDPHTRWTPRQAAAHPFITEAPFRGPFNPPPDPDHPTSCNDSPTAMSIASTYSATATPWLTGTPTTSFPPTALASPQFPVPMSPLELHAQAHALALAAVKHLSPHGTFAMPPPNLHPSFHYPPSSTAPQHPATHTIHGSFPNPSHFPHSFSPHSLPTHAFPTLPNGFPSNPHSNPHHNPHSNAHHNHQIAAAAAAAAVMAQSASNPLHIGGTPTTSAFFYPPSAGRPLPIPPSSQRGAAPYPSGSSLPQSFINTFGLSPLDPNSHHNVAAAAAAAAVASMANRGHHQATPPQAAMFYPGSVSTAHAIPNYSPYYPPSSQPSPASSRPYPQSKPLNMPTGTVSTAGRPPRPDSSAAHVPSANNSLGTSLEPPATKTLRRTSLDPTPPAYSTPPTTHMPSFDGTTSPADLSPTDASPSQVDPSDWDPYFNADMLEDPTDERDPATSQPPAASRQLQLVAAADGSQADGFGSYQSLNTLVGHEAAPTGSSLGAPPLLGSALGSSGHSSFQGLGALSLSYGSGGVGSYGVGRGLEAAQLAMTPDGGALAVANGWMVMGNGIGSAAGAGQPNGGGLPELAPMNSLPYSGFMPPSMGGLKRKGQARK